VSHFPTDSIFYARLAIVATVSFLVLLVGLHVLQREFDPRTRYVSEYVLGPYGAVMSVAFYTLALAAGALAIAFFLEGRVPRAPVGLALSVWAGGLVMAGIWPTDPGGTIELTREGTLHNTGARLAFLGASAAAALLPVQLMLTGSTRWLLPIAIGTGLLVVGSFALLRYSPAWLGPGATQRLLISGILLFHVAAAMSVLDRSSYGVGT